MAARIADEERSREDELRTLQEWMGHASVKTTEIYADYAPSEHEREWVEAAFRGTSGGTRRSEPKRTERT
jgi:integrase